MIESGATATIRRGRFGSLSGGWQYIWKGNLSGHRSHYVRGLSRPETSG